MTTSSRVTLYGDNSQPESRLAQHTADLRAYLESKGVGFDYVNWKDGLPAIMIHDSVKKYPPFTHSGLFGDNGTFEMPNRDDVADLLFGWAEQILAAA